MARRSPLPFRRTTRTECVLIATEGARPLLGVGVVVVTGAGMPVVAVVPAAETVYVIVTCAGLPAALTTTVPPGA